MLSTITDSGARILQMAYQIPENLLGLKDRVVSFATESFNRMGTFWEALKEYISGFITRGFQLLNITALFSTTDEKSLTLFQKAVIIALYVFSIFGALYSLIHKELVFTSLSLILFLVTSYTSSLIQTNNTLSSLQQIDSNLTSGVKGLAEENERYRQFNERNEAISNSLSESSSALDALVGQLKAHGSVTAAQLETLAEVARSLTQQKVNTEGLQQAVDGIYSKSQEALERVASLQAQIEGLTQRLAQTQANLAARPRPPLADIKNVDVV